MLRGLVDPPAPAPAGEKGLCQPRNWSL